MTSIRVILVGLIACVYYVSAGVNAEEMVARVYEDDNISIRAGIINLEGRIIHFGDVLPLVVSITYNSEEVQLQDMDPAFFTTS